MTQAERAAKIQEVGEYFLKNKLPSLKVIATKFNISTVTASIYISKHLRNKNIRVIK